MYFFFFKLMTAYDMRISDWSSDVCSSDLPRVSEKSAIAQGPCRSTQAAFDEFPVDQVPERLDILRPRVAVIDVIGVFPHIAGKQRVIGAEIGRASCRERVCQYV